MITNYYPEFQALDDGRFRCLARTLDDGRYIVITNMGGMDYPTHEDFMVCVYKSEDAFPAVEEGDLLGTFDSVGAFDSNGFADIDHALGAAEGCTEVQS